jgi:hypothetical protein
MLLEATEHTIRVKARLLNIKRVPNRPYITTGLFSWLIALRI